MKIVLSSDAPIDWRTRKDYIDIEGTCRKWGVPIGINTLLGFEEKLIQAISSRPYVKHEVLILADKTFVVTNNLQIPYAHIVYELSISENAANDEVKAIAAAAEEARSRWELDKVTQLSRREKKQAVADKNLAVLVSADKENTVKAWRDWAKSFKAVK